MLLHFRRRRIANTSYALLAFALASCSSDNARFNEPSEPIVRDVAFQLSACPSGAPVQKCWDANEIISVSISPSTHATALQTAIKNWSDLLREGPAPRFEYVESGGDVRVEVAAGAAPYCGGLGDTPKPFVITVLPASQCGNGKTAALATLLRHELSGALGWADEAERYPYKHQGVGVSDNCAVALDSIAPYFHSFVCLHDVEAVTMLYRNVAYPLYQEEYWGKPILKGSNVDTLPIASLQPGASVQRAFSQFRSFQNPSAYPASLPRTVAHATWSSDNSAIATVSPSGLITGVAGGTTYIRVRPRLDSVPSTYRIWSPFELRGDSIRVSVVLDTLLRVTNVTSPGAPPFTTAGTKVFTASIAGFAPSPAVQVTWQVDFSSNGIGWDATWTGGTSYSLSVPAGSYSIAVRATPKQGSKTGAAYQSDWPVCTGGGEPDFASQQSYGPGGC